MEISKILLIAFFPLSVSAQQTFTEHLTRQVAGEGTVSLSQDAEIDALVNGVGTRNASANAQHKTRPESAAQPTTSANTPDATNVTGTTEGVAASHQNGHRTQTLGYRIQVYAGGNNRQSKAEAYRMASLVRSYFLDVNVYTNFISPRWVCRVGDFKTREEAVEQLRKMQLTQKFGEASIVKSKIIVTY